MAKSSKVTLGRSEYVHLPEWGIKHLLAKTDTGAKTSAIHVDDLKVLKNGHVRFTVVVARRPERLSVTVDAKPLRWAKVLSSTGHYTKRCFISTRIIIGEVEKEIEISLIDRELMKYRMLLGCQALAKDFVIDVSKQHALTDRLKPKKRPKVTHENRHPK
jgi:hypothetical protein